MRNTEIYPGLAVRIKISARHVESDKACVFVTLQKDRQHLSTGGSGHAKYNIRKTKSAVSTDLFSRKTGFSPQKMT